MVHSMELFLVRSSKETYLLSELFEQIDYVGHLYHTAWEQLAADHAQLEDRSDELRQDSFHCSQSASMHAIFYRLL